MEEVDDTDEEDMHALRELTAEMRQAGAIGDVYIAQLEELGLLEEDPSDE